MFQTAKPIVLLTTLLDFTARIPSAVAMNGIATYYGGNTAGGNCMFSSYSLPSGVYGTALAGPTWNSAAQCGACVRVTGPQGNSIKAMVCPFSFSLMCSLASHDATPQRNTTAHPFNPPVISQSTLARRVVSLPIPKQASAPHPQGPQRTTQLHQGWNNSIRVMAPSAPHSGTPSCPLTLRNSTTSIGRVAKRLRRQVQDQHT